MIYNTILKGILLETLSFSHNEAFVMYHYLLFFCFSIEFFDEVAKMEPHESEERDSPDVAVLPEQKEYAKKIFQLSGLQIELTSNDSVQGRDMSGLKEEGGGKGGEERERGYV